MGQPHHYPAYVSLSGLPLGIAWVGGWGAFVGREAACSLHAGDLVDPSEGHHLEADRFAADHFAEVR